MPTKEQWKALESKLQDAYGKAELKIDGYDIALAVERTAPLKYVIAIYVNGYIKWEYLNGGCEEGRRFMREMKRQSYSEKERKLWHSIDGLTKRQIAKDKKAGTGRFATSSYYLPYFNSFRALKSKLINNNESIEVVSIGYDVQDVQVPRAHGCAGEADE